MIAALLLAASVSQTITLRIIMPPPEPPQLEAPPGGHWLLTLADEGTWCQPPLVGCWSAEWVADEPPQIEPPPADGPEV